MNVDHLVKWISSHYQNECHTDMWKLLWELHPCTTWLSGVCRMLFNGWVWPNALLPLTEQMNEKGDHHEGHVWLCVLCVCVRVWEPLRYQAIAHLSMTAQLCQHSPSVILSTLIHTIMNDEILWQKCHIYLNCSLALIFSVNIISWLLSWEWRTFMTTVTFCISLKEMHFDQLRQLMYMTLVFFLWML